MPEPPALAKQVVKTTKVIDHMIYVPAVVWRELQLRNGDQVAWVRTAQGYLVIKQEVSEPT